MAVARFWGGRPPLCEGPSTFGAVTRCAVVRPAAVVGTPQGCGVDGAFLFGDFLKQRRVAVGSQQGRCVVGAAGAHL
jgi:hypothetical protein